ncbi:Arabinanase/levansucrase/invertase [Dendrothele bispora CBS 962.96]|uniref:Arabinanase/levansucrase/invertase n=1 Tax=Dendrothele bispora (strain CBS 962.96) TaxID=1314807 RepID=A0A4S8LHY0_DENBC|nr:Arabinanase/levansucrase/invertase [Dendrothele bispora CBS 962.96]THU88470.1 Arabinanase/levansucrase/invertase [Dendrothele bispora CBS 962.96]
MSWFLTLLAVLGVVQAAVIVPGATWTDTSGNVIQAHGGGFLKVGSTFYWFGEDKTLNSALFRAVSCYTSTDLVSWSRQNDALTPISGTMISTSNIVERPKVLFNTNNQEYVMWFHSDSSNYGAAMVGVATAKTPCGPYTYKGSFQPLGAQSRDMGLFQDDDGTAYLLYASDNNQNFKVSRLDANYYNVTQQASVLSGSTLESPGIIKKNGAYYLFASHTTGWDPNPNKFFKATSLSGPWSAQADIAPQATRTYFSQNAFDMPLGSNGIYMGDRWRPSLLGSSRYIWYPLSWTSGSPQIVAADVWSVNIAAGTYTVATGTSYEAENGALSGSSQILTGSGFSGGRAAGWLGNGGSVTINNVQGVGRDQWVALYYANGDSTWRNTTVSVNGGPSVMVDQPNTGNGQTVLSVPVKLNLRNGANSITFSNGQSNYAADLDKIIVYTAN